MIEKSVPPLVLCRRVFAHAHVHAHAQHDSYIFFRLSIALPSRTEGLDPHHSQLSLFFSLLSTFISRCIVN